MVGGVVFGVLMGIMGMFTMIAAMLGSDSILVGLGVHLMMSVVIGLVLTVPFGTVLLTSVPRGLVTGLAYGLLWWIMGPLVVMPLMLGMPIFTIDQAAVFSLMGHVVYGAILGVVAAAIIRRGNAR
ncbi:MAG: hypothetical protein KJ659_07895 [Actinobacteria bacterium]|nr:hypothetical protein [Actinomycetota bacterium]MBU1608419.1 hypothetical protein [Actinomycetota bacterium]MBU2316459.1 hypothetical protein [Actinomycetota bacterium]MBU2385407.1 hypothetical protein [Actinomycetota bacterium]QOD94911.1 hypothetical protein IE160_08330 [Chryseoglobus sp. 28M-23]